MSNIDKRALREAAEKASTDNHTQDEWFHYLRCSTPETVLALLDELEKMQAQSSKWCEAFHKAVPLALGMRSGLLSWSAMKFAKKETSFSSFGTRGSFLS